MKEFYITIFGPQLKNACDGNYLKNRTAQQVIEERMNNIKFNNPLPHLSESLRALIYDSHLESIKADIARKVSEYVWHTGDYLVHFMDTSDKNPGGVAKYEIKSLWLSDAEKVLDGYINEPPVLDQLPRFAKKASASATPVSPSSLEETVRHILDNSKFAVRVREGGGAEDLAASIAVTCIKMEKMIEESENGRSTS